MASLACCLPAGGRHAQHGGCETRGTSPLSTQVAEREGLGAGQSIHPGVRIGPVGAKTIRTRHLRRSVARGQAIASGRRRVRGWIAQCESHVGQPIVNHDWSGAAEGIVGCLTADLVATTKLLATALSSAFPETSLGALGKLAYKISSKLLLVAATGAFFDISTWLIDQHLGASAWDLYVFPEI
jgi:hypothetical protein